MSTIVLYCASAAFDLLEKAYICSDNVVLQILARRCFNDVQALCDIYHISVDTLLKRSVHYVKALFLHHFISSFY